VDRHTARPTIHKFAQTFLVLANEIMCFDLSSEIVVQDIHPRTFYLRTEVAAVVRIDLV